MRKISKTEQGSFLGSRRFWEVAFPLCMAALSAYLWTVAGAFQGGSARYEMIGPGFFPRLILGASLLLCVTIAGRAIWSASPKNDPAPGVEVRWRGLLAAAVITFAYAASLSHAGFLIATLAFQAVLLAAVFQVRRLFVLIIAPLLLTGILIVVFAILMNVPLPRGSGLFADFSRIFY